MPLVTPLAQMPRVHLSKFGDYPCIVMDFDIADTLPSGAPLPVVATTSGRLIPCNRREFDVFWSPTATVRLQSVNVTWAVRHPDELLCREPIRVKIGQRDLLAQLEGVLEDNHPVVVITPGRAMLETLSQYLRFRGSCTTVPQSLVPRNQLTQSLASSSERHVEIVREAELRGASMDEAREVEEHRSSSSLSAVSVSHSRSEEQPVLVEFGVLWQDVDGCRTRVVHSRTSRRRAPSTP